MPKFGIYTLSDELWSRANSLYQSCLEGVDLEPMIDGSGSMSLPSGIPMMTRMDAVRHIGGSIAAAVFRVDDKIDAWLIQEPIRSLLRPMSGPLHADLKSPDDFLKFLNGIRPKNGTPLREVLQAAVDRFIKRLKKNKDAKSTEFLILCDGHDGNVQDIIQRAAIAVHEITGEDPRGRIGFQFVITAKEGKIVDDFNGFDNKAVYEYDGKTLETDIVDVTTLDDIEKMGGFDSPLTLLKTIGGAMSEELDNLLTELKDAAQAAGAVA